MKDGSGSEDSIESDSPVTQSVPPPDAGETTDGAGSRRWAWPDDRGQYDWMDHCGPSGNSWW